MNNDETLNDYEVGYGKPPKDTQFQKGVSGNPKGRPKKCRNPDEDLIRESESLMPITENGQRKRLSKHEVAIKQLINQVIGGNHSAQRMYFRLRQQAHERAALMVGLQTSNAGKNDKVKYLTEEELMWIVAGGLEKTEPKNGKGHVSNTE